MKKLSRALAVLMVATLSLSSVSASAAEVTEVTRAHERPAFSENAEGFKANFKFGTMRNGGDREKIEMTDEEKAAKLEAFKNTLAEKLSSGEITQEEYDDAIAKMESGEFTFGGKAFKGMKGEKPEMFSFDSDHFQNMKDKLSEMTDEEKAAMMENLKTGDSKKVPADMPFKGMQGERPAKPSFDSERFQDLKGKLADMTEEEKAEMLENLKAAEGENPFTAKFAGVPKAGVRMMGKPSAETENEA